MRKYKIKPYALLLRRNEVRRILPEEISINAEGKGIDLFGVVLDLKAFEKIDNPKTFMEYTFGETNKPQ